MAMRPALVSVDPRSRRAETAYRNRPRASEGSAHPVLDDALSSVDTETEQLIESTGTADAGARRS